MAVSLFAGIVLIAVGVEFAAAESEDVGRAPFIVLGAISAAAGLAIAGLGLLMARGRRDIGSRAALTLALVVLAVGLAAWGGLLLGIVPAAAALLIVAQGFLPRSYRGRTA